MSLTLRDLIIVPKLLSYENVRKSTSGDKVSGLLNYIGYPDGVSIKARVIKYFSATWVYYNARVLVEIRLSKEEPFGGTHHERDVYRIPV